MQKKLPKMFNTRGKFPQDLQAEISTAAENVMIRWIRDCDISRPIVPRKWQLAVKTA